MPVISHHGKSQTEGGNPEHAHHGKSQTEGGKAEHAPDRYKAPDLNSPSLPLISGTARCPSYLPNKSF